MQTYGLAQNFGVPVTEIRLREENAWQPDPADVAKAVMEKTRVVVVTNPNNPTGAILSPEARLGILAAVRRTGAWILADEVYRGTELRGAETESFFNQYERVIATGSLSRRADRPNRLDRPRRHQPPAHPGAHSRL